MNGWFALIIADIAITDHAFAVSKVGASYLKAYTYGTISKISSNSLKNKSEEIPASGTEYTNITIGEYIIYGVNKSQEYINKLKCLCLARSLGEEIMNMEF